MKRTKIGVLAALLSIGATAPALADYVQLGSVDVGYRSERSTAYTRFGGGMEGLRLEARGSSIACDSIRAEFADGDRQKVFSGRLFPNQPVSVDLRGGTRVVNRLDFQCKADDRDGTIYIAGDLGRYRDTWRNSAYWNPGWGGPMNPPQRPDYRDPLSGPGSFDIRDWSTFGRETFGSRPDRSQTVSGFRGRASDRIALRARGADAGCSRVVAYFTDGRSVDLQAPSRRMSRGAIYQIDLPGGVHNIDRLDLLCRAVDARSVEIEIYARNK